MNARKFWKLVNDREKLAKEWDEEHPFDKDILINPYRGNRPNPNDPWIKLVKPEGVPVATHIHGSHQLNFYDT